VQFLPDDTFKTLKRMRGSLRSARMQLDAILEDDPDNDALKHVRDRVDAAVDADIPMFAGTTLEGLGAVAYETEV